MERIEQIALTMIPGLGAKAIRQLIGIYPDRSIFSLTPAEVQATFGDHRAIAEAILHKTTFARAEEELRFVERHHLRTIFLTDPDYPERMLRDETADCPPLLYVMGQADLNADHAVAVVGTRHATPQGRDNTARIVEQLKPYNASIISGLAYGIDTAAHIAALDHGLPTVAVLGHGLDRIYPPANQRLAERIVENGGALVTEYPSGTAINPGYFPARNRIIAALADGTLVIESSKKGGALITATIAAGYHREVFALPGRLTDTYSVGTNNLIATSKALLARNADDIAYHLGWPLAEAQSSKDNQQTLFQTFTSEERQVVDLLRTRDQLQLDELTQLTGLPMPKLAALMFNLEMQQVVRTAPGRTYQFIN